MARKRTVRLQETNLFAFANEQISVKETQIEKPKKRFEVGKLYSLQSTEYDGLSPKEENVYQLVGIIQQINGIDFPSLIMKAIKTNSSMVFALTKADCQKLGVDFQPRLQLFPIDMGWINVEGEVAEVTNETNEEFNDEDLSTYPVDRNTRTINMMTIRLVGFVEEGHFIKTPTGNTILKSDFVKSLTISYNSENEPYENAHKHPINGRFVTACLRQVRKDCIVDNESQSIFIEIDLRYKDLSNDKYYGLNPEFLKNKNINQLIRITWEETESYNEYHDNIINYLGKRNCLNNNIPDIIWANDEFTEIYRGLSSNNSKYIVRSTI